MLPEAFTKRMKTLLAEEYGAFLDSFSRPRAVALRLNPLKTQGASRFVRLFAAPRAVGAVRLLL